MDPATFTQKLLERTQARKEALKRKNDEFNACRNKRTAPSPAKPTRRPLTEENIDAIPSKPTRTHSAEEHKDSCLPVKQRPVSEDNNNGGLTDEFSRRRIASDGNVPKTPTKVTMAARAPATPKSVSSNLTGADKCPATPTSVSKVRAGLQSDAASSPSIRARKEQLILMQQKDQESTIAPKKHWKKALDMNDTKSPSVAARSAIFENTKEKSQTMPTPTTPGKLSAKRGVFEKQTSMDAKPASTAPPKPPRGVQAEKTLHREQSSSKRKAPPPPIDNADGTARNAEGSVVSERKNVEEVPAKKEKTNERDPTPKKPVRTHVEVAMKPVAMDTVDKEPVTMETVTVEPVAKPRKRMQNDEENYQNKLRIERDIKELEEKRERRREERKKARIEMREKEEIVVAHAQGVEEGCHSRIRHVEAGEVSAIEARSSKQNIPRPKPRVEVVVEPVKVKTHVNNDRKESEIVPVTNSSKPERPPLPQNHKQVLQESKPVHSKQILQEPKHVYSKQVLQEPKPVYSQPEVSVKPQSHNKVEMTNCIPQSTETAPKTHQDDLKESKPVQSTKQPTQKQENNLKRIPTNRQDLMSLAKHGSASHLRSTENLHRYGSLGDMYPDGSALDETVNLNDVNIHEMTFTFDFSDFDKMQEDTETKFQKSFNETQQELKKEKKLESKSIEVEKVRTIAHQPRPTANVEEKNNGIFKSGYSMDVDDKYATKVYKKEKPPVPERPKPTQEKIKDILDEAASHQNIILQTSQALNVCESSNDIFKGSQEEIEAERVLLLASERKQACLNEHHRLKAGRKDSKKGPPIDPKACTSTVSIAGIRLALKQEFMDVLRVGIRNDLGVYHFVCHVQHGPVEITSTKALSIHDCTGDHGNYLVFPDKFVMKNLNADFNIVVRVFGMHVLKSNPYTASAGQKHKLFQSPKNTKNKRGVPDGTSPRGTEPLPVFRTSNFKLLGSTRITLPKVSSKKWGLEGNMEGCPLKETINMKIHCMPQYTSCVKGFLTILEDVGGYSAWQRRWCVLEGGMLSHWRYPGEEVDKAPLGTLDIGQCNSERIVTVPRDLCARPNTIEVAMRKEGQDDYKFLLACDTKEDRITWLDCLNDALTDMRAWKSNNKKILYPEISHSANEKVHMC